MKGALFDLDGVLIDTEPTYSIFWASIGREYGLRPTFASDIKGTNLTKILMEFRPEDRVEVGRKIHEFEDNMQYDFFPGVMDYLQRLKSEGVKIAIVTSSDDVKMRLLYAQHPGFKDVFDAVIDGSMVTRSKPDPEGYLKAAKAICVPISDCTVYEDSLQGLEAGRRSGAYVIGFATTNPRERIAPLADEVFDDIADLLSRL